MPVDDDPATRHRVHRAELPLAQRNTQMRLSKQQLSSCRWRRFQPELDQDDTAIDDVLLDRGAQSSRKPPGAPSSSRIPSPARLRPGCCTASIEDHDLARAREVRHVALDVHLRLLSLRLAPVTPPTENGETAHPVSALIRRLSRPVDAHDDHVTLLLGSGVQNLPPRLPVSHLRLDGAATPSSAAASRR